MILRAVSRHPKNREALRDATGASLAYGELTLRAHVLAQALKRLDAEPFMGVMLPTSAAAAVTFFALHSLRRAPAMLNFTAGERALKLACDLAGLKTVITSRAFVEKARLEEVVSALPARVAYLEDLRARLTPMDKALGAFAARLPLKPAAPSDIAVILFTSGSEAMPKGVALSHGNLMANIRQAAERFEFGPEDVMFNALPVFHSFGLMAGMLLPLALGFRAYLYPTPLHYQTIPPLVRKERATILLGTDTFFSGYARHARPEDFETLRFGVGGAEKLKSSTRKLYAEKFGVTLLEGYGVTEASPVISANTLSERKEGTTGRLMPGMEARLEPVEGMARGGRLWVKGPNIMLGYLGGNRRVIPQGEWYDTGDIAEIDAEGYVSILGRARRFAKIGGEMVPLSLAEEAATALWPDHAHAAIAVPDERKGEQVTLFSECADATREAIVAHAREAGLPEIALPRHIVHVPEMPRLGSGKIDYMALKDIFPLPLQGGGLRRG